MPESLYCWGLLPGLPVDKFLIQHFLEGIDIFPGGRIGTDNLLITLAISLVAEWREHRVQQFYHSGKMYTIDSKFGVKHLLGILGSGPGQAVIVVYLGWGLVLE